VRSKVFLVFRVHYCHSHQRPIFHVHLSDLRHWKRGVLEREHLEGSQYLQLASDCCELNTWIKGCFYISIKELPSFLLKMPPNLKMYWPEKAVAAELAEGVLRGLILWQVLFWGSKTSHYLVTSPSEPENPPIRYILSSTKQIECEERSKIILHTKSRLLR